MKENYICPDCHKSINPDNCKSCEICLEIVCNACLYKEHKNTYLCKLCAKDLYSTKTRIEIWEVR